MFRPSCRLLAVLLALLAVSAQAQLPRPVAAALKAAGIPASAVGLVVYEVGATKPSLSVNAEQPFNPASTIKLLTTFAALDMLGPQFSWKTEAWLGGSQIGDTLEGDLILRGGGDPKLTVESLWLMARALRARGLRHIRGNLVLDRSYFDAGNHDPGQFDAEPLRPYNVGPDALLINFKSVRLTFVPDSLKGIAQVLADPRPTQLELTHAVRLGDGTCNDWRAQLKASFQGARSGAKVSFSGVYPAQCGEKTWNVAVLSHPEYVYGTFRQIWEETGGTLAGHWKDGPVPPDARLLYTHESPALAEVVRDINKYSNNVMAKQLFLTLSAAVLKPPGAASDSTQLINSWLIQRAIHAPELVLENGSGLSRSERISAGNLARMLQVAFHSAVMPELMASLPLVAHDGTMKRRLKNAAVAGQAHIKTGSLADVRAIAGYVLDRAGRRHVVVFIINHANASAGQSAQDALLHWVYGSGAKGGPMHCPGGCR